MENTVPKKRQRKKSRMAKESNEMDFIESSPSDLNDKEQQVAKISKEKKNRKGGVNLRNKASRLRKRRQMA